MANHYQSPRARRRHLIIKIGNTIFYTIVAACIILGVMALMGCAAEVAANLMRM